MFAHLSLVFEAQFVSGFTLRKLFSSQNDNAHAQIYPLISCQMEAIVYNYKLVSII